MLPPEPRAWSRPPFEISTDPARLDLDVIHHYLSQESYWARNIPRDLVAKAMAYSRCYGIYEGPSQVGFGRLVTDYATFAYVGDIFVLADHRGKGLSKWLVECMLSDPDVQGLRNWTLYTKDAQRLYARYGFQPPADPRSVMTIKVPNPYNSPSEGAGAW
jgi:GNAT superfamily N-acetyltransferase